ncbi:MAG: hypothetical protein WC516_07085 [Patescibacteria group bacterium]|jgi:hypothetical protein
MKLVNSKEIGKILDENTDPIYVVDDFNESEHRSPCWEARIDKLRNKISFLVDKEEKLSVALSKFKSNEITVDLLASFIKLLREGKIDELKRL